LNLERGLSWLYAGSWPAKLWALVPGSTRVTLLRHDVLVPGRAVRLPPPHDDVTLLGLDDPLTRLSVTDRLTHEATVGAALENVRDVPVKVALCHSPDGFRSVRGKGIALYLCGHTHGGHIALPGYRPIIMPSPDGRRWPWGRHEVDGTSLFVSRGVGGSLVPVRTWAPPDVAVFTIR
jgi:hypothetical protein